MGHSLSGRQVYSHLYRATWLGKISEPGVRLRAAFYFQQLDVLRELRQQVRRELLAEGKKHASWKQLCQIPCIGPIRTAMLIGILQTPHRFRTKRQLWSFSGFGIETRSSADHRYIDGQLRRSKKQVYSRAEPKSQSRSEETLRARPSSPANLIRFAEFYAALLAKGTRPEMARLTLARKIAAITLHVWKKGDTRVRERVSAG